MRGHLFLSLCFGGILAHVGLAAYHAPVWSSGSLLFPTWMLAGVAWCGALWLGAKGHLSLGPLVLGAIVLRLIALASWPDLSDDIFRYAWEGELITRGWSPFAYGPEHPDVAHLVVHMPEIHRQINHPEVSAAYPPLTQAACAAVMALEHVSRWGEVFLLRLFFAFCDLLVLWPLVSLLQSSKKPVGLAVAWAWSPLVVAEFAGSGHFDSLGILLLLGSLALHARTSSGQSIAAPLLLAGAILVKYIPLLALPFLVRERHPWRRGMLVMGLVAIAFLPVLFLRGGAEGLFSGISNYGLRWQSSGIVHPHLARLFDGLFPQDGSILDARRLVRLALGNLWAFVAIWSWRRKLEPVQASGLLLGAFLLLSPTLHPWYVTWIVPFIALGNSRAWIWLALSIPLTYLTLERWKLAGVWEQSMLVQGIIVVPLLILLVLDVRRSLAEAKSVEAIRV